MYCKPCESTDILNMAKKAASIFVENDLDLDLGDRVFCLVDLDLEQTKYDKFITAKKKYKKIDIIPSNPCFEVWLQYYFTKFPKGVGSSQKAKDEMSKYLPGYTESMDVVAEAHLGMNDHVKAIQNSEMRNSYYSSEQSLIEKNPYTDVATVVEVLVVHKTN